MPFKTKRHKIKAGARRISISEHGLAGYSSTAKTTDEGEKPAKKIVEVLGKENFVNYSYLRGDIAKTALLALGIIGLQLIIKLIRLSV